jgi:hypothetical protein
MNKKASKKLIQEVMLNTQSELGKRGYKKRAGQIFTLNFTSDFIGWLGLNRAVQRGDGSLAINPVIGVRYQQLERALADLMDEDFHQYIPPTISVNVGYLMSENAYKTWSFKENTDNQRIVADMVAAVEKYGRPFMVSMSSEDSLVEALEVSDYSIPANRKFRLPLIHHMQGDIERARDELTKNLAELNKRKDLAAQQYRYFAERLLAKF